MKRLTGLNQLLVVASVLVFAGLTHGQIDITKTTRPGEEKPIWVSLTGFSGEAAEVIRFDLYVQGFNFTNAEAAQFLISGSNDGNLTGRVTDRFNNATKLNKSYSGATLRRQAHAFVDDFLQSIEQIGRASCRERV